MRTNIKRIFSILLAVACLFAGGIAVFANADSARNVVLHFLATNVTAPTISTVGGEWAVLALARGNGNVSASFYDAYINRVRDVLRANNGNLPGPRTEFARVVLALSALGVDVTNIDGHNLITPLENFAEVTAQGVNGAAFALLALDSNGWGNTAVRQQYVNFLVGREITGGGFALGNSTAPAADITGMVLAALAPYASQQAVAAVVSRGLATLQPAALTTAEHAAWAIIAQRQHGASHDAAVASLLTFQQANGSFRHNAAGGGNTQMATEQAALALVSLDIDLLNMSDVPSRALPELPPAPARPGALRIIWDFIVAVFSFILAFAVLILEAFS
ncbi:MAG: hypothetical protein FWD06_04775 [Oscillospiraceae bacterium]|nr:hypothetical protein [Oscillospiraceae bacterium]